VQVSLGGEKNGERIVKKGDCNGPERASLRNGGLAEHNNRPVRKGGSEDAGVGAGCKQRSTQPMLAEKAFKRGISGSSGSERGDLQQPDECRGRVKC